MSHAAKIQIDYLDPRSLHPDPQNPRLISDEDMGKLRRSLSHWGVVEPVIVNRRGMRIIGGHQRVQAAIEEGLAEVPVVLLDLPEEEARALNVALNRIQGEWDLPSLAQVLQELEASGLEVGLTGFDGEDLQQLLADLEQETGVEIPDEAFDLQQALEQAERRLGPTRTQPGDLWQLGRHRLLCGDSLDPRTLERVCQGQLVPLVLTDPPYGIDYQSRMTKPDTVKAPIAHDDYAGFEQFLERALGAVKAVMTRGGALYWFCGGGGPKPVLGQALLAVARHFHLLNCLVWDKETPGLGWRWRHSWEAIIEASVGEPAYWQGGLNKRNVLHYPKLIPQADDHPTPKPVELLAEIMQAASPPRSSLLDPFCGSGSTLIAAEACHRSCLAVELEPRYCDLTLARWESFTESKAEMVPRHPAPKEEAP